MTGIPVTKRMVVSVSQLSPGDILLGSDQTVLAIANDFALTYDGQRRRPEHAGKAEVYLRRNKTGSKRVVYWRKATKLTIERPTT